MAIFAGCEDSTSDVGVAEVSPPQAVAIPDTVFTIDGVTVEFFGAQNAYAIERGIDEWSNEGVERLRSQSSADFSSLDPIGAVVLRAIGVDGRIMEATWYPLHSSDGDLRAVVHVQEGDREFVVSLGNEETAQPWTPEKQAWRPSQIFALESCGQFARALYVACVSTCIGAGLNHCHGPCTAATSAAWMACLFTE
jgi:hypothetical protein